MKRVRKLLEGRRAREVYRDLMYDELETAEDELDELAEDMDLPEDFTRDELGLDPEEDS